MDPDSSSPRSRPPSRLRRFGAAGLQVSVTDGRGRAVRDGGLARWLARVAPVSARGEVAIALVSDARMRTLNRTYRRKDYATDVLSFVPDAEPASPPAVSAPRTAHPSSLGDLVIATGVAKRQAREAQHTYQTELRVLALHGLLHLLGYDHEDRNSRGRMQRVEERLRRTGGLTAGLIRRAGVSGRLKSASTPEAPARGRRSKVPRIGTAERARAAVGPREQ